MSCGQICFFIGKLDLFFVYSYSRTGTAQKTRENHRFCTLACFDVKIFAPPDDQKSDMFTSPLFSQGDRHFFGATADFMVFSIANTVRESNKAISSYGDRI